MSDGGDKRGLGPPLADAIDRIVQTLLANPSQWDANPVDVLRKAIEDAGYEVDEESFAAYRAYMEEIPPRSS